MNRYLFISPAVVFCVAALLAGGCLYAFDEGAEEADNGVLVDDDLQDDDLDDDDNAMIDDDLVDDDIVDDDNDDDLVDDDDSIDDDIVDDDVTYDYLAAGVFTTKAAGFIWQNDESSTMWDAQTVFPLVTEWAAESISCHESGVCWAVGSGDIGVQIGLLLKFDGNNWFADQSPISGGGWGLTDVVVDRTDHSWAVGSFESHLSILLEWDGVTWQETAVSWPYTPNGLAAVDSAADDTAIAVGYLGLNSAQSGFAMHWDGEQWNIRELPAQPAPYLLRDVAALAADSAFALGYAESSNESLLFAWNGSNWLKIDLPAGNGSYLLESISAFSPQDAVCSGYYLSNTTQVLLVFHDQGWTLSEVAMAGNPSAIFMTSPQSVLVGGEGFIHEIQLGQSIQSHTLPATNTIIRGFTRKAQ